jgi:hypothetical protein
LGDILLFAHFRVAIETLVFIEAVFFTPEPVFVFQFGMAKPATVFVAVVLLAPEPSFFAFRWVADVAEIIGNVVSFAGFLSLGFFPVRCGVERIGGIDERRREQRGAGE